jgi:muconolactone D-isomerase
MEFLVHITFAWPPGMDEGQRAALVARERARAAELAQAGHLVRIWRVPGQSANRAIWRAADATELHDLITTLPAAPWFTGVEVLPLARHPSDPGAHPPAERSLT